MKKLTMEDFLEKSKKIHGDKYDYSLVEYINNKTKVKIICSEHGVFQTRPDNHIGSKSGCPKCVLLDNNSFIKKSKEIHKKYGCYFCKESQGERKISLLLEEIKIKYIRQKAFDGCKNKQKLQFDFYLPDYNICIEFDGIQHYKPIDYFGGKEQLVKIKKNDKIKEEYCQKYNIRLIRIKYNEKIEKIINLI